MSYNKHPCTPTSPDFLLSKKMLEALEGLNDSTCNDWLVLSGYISFNDALIFFKINRNKAIVDIHKQQVSQKTYHNFIA